MWKSEKGQAWFEYLFLKVNQELKDKFVRFFSLVQQAGRTATNLFFYS